MPSRPIGYVTHTPA